MWFENSKDEYGSGTYDLLVRMEPKFYTNKKIAVQNVKAQLIVIY